MYKSTQWPLANLQERHHKHTASYDTGLFEQTKYNIDSWAWLLSTAAPPRWLNTNQSQENTY